MSTQQALPSDHPVMKAWERYQRKEEYQNTLKWAMNEGYTEGSLWAAFIEGWQAAMNTPAANPAEPPKVQELLTRDHRDALVAANALLAIMQDDRTEMFGRIQPIVDAISDLLYDK